MEGEQSCQTPLWAMRLNHILIALLMLSCLQSTPFWGLGEREEEPCQTDLLQSHHIPITTISTKRLSMSRLAFFGCSVVVMLALRLQQFSYCSYLFLEGEVGRKCTRFSQPLG